MADLSLQRLYELHRGKASDKWSIYLREYDRLLGPFRGYPLRMLEIGIQNGGSLEIWSRYFSLAQKIVGCDINPDCAKLHYDDQRIFVVVGDANTESVEHEILKKSTQFDVVIDDGSHTSSDIVRSFARYFPHLSDGGVFIVEDTHCGYWAQFQGGLLYPASSIEFFKRLADIVSFEHWGVPRARKDLIATFRREYEFDIDEEVLSHIHSVEFINSLCVVRKAVPSDNVAGFRFIAGDDEIVVGGHRELHMAPGATADESGNRWSSFKELPEETALAAERDIARLNGHVRALTAEKQLLSVEAGLLAKRLDDECSKSIEHLTAARLALQQQVGLEREIDALRRSTSWRVTVPLRWLRNQHLRARRLLRVLPAGIAMNGGWMPTVKKAVGILRVSGPSGLRRALGLVEIATAGLDSAALSGATVEGGPYASWIEKNDSVTDEVRDSMRGSIELFEERPTISIVMPSYNANVRWLDEAVESIKRQIYPYWELCIADDASTLPECKAMLLQLAATDQRIKLILREDNGHISAASNSALSLATGDWIALMDQDDILSEHALFWVAKRINDCPDTQLIYSDEDKIDEFGVRSQPYFKPDWNSDLFLSQNVFCHLGVIRVDLMHKVGGFRLEFEGAQDYDLVLRCIEHVSPSQIQHIPRVLYHWRMHAASTALSGNAKPYAVVAGERALNEHCQRTGVDAVVEHVGPGYRIRYALPAVEPLVSLIIPTRNAHELLRQCVDSITSLTSYQSYEIVIVDNGSDDLESLAYFTELAHRPNISVIRDDGEFNYSAINNLAVRQARGSVIGLINNDVEVISPDWLGEMVSIALQPGVGAVGARLLYPDRRLQHGGVVLGIGGVAGHSHKYLDEWQSGYFSRARLIQSYSAVTAACLVVRKDRYLEVGGLNEKELKVAFNDVDFCLRLREIGLRNVWTPYAELFHHESATRGAEISPAKQSRFNSEVDYMLKRWDHWLSNDPAYSPNLTLIREDFSYAAAPRLHSYKAG